MTIDTLVINGEQYKIVYEFNPFRRETYYRIKDNTIVLVNTKTEAETHLHLLDAYIRFHKGDKID